MSNVMIEKLREAIYKVEAGWYNAATNDTIDELLLNIDSCKDNVSDEIPSDIEEIEEIDSEQMNEVFCYKDKGFGKRLYINYSRVAQWVYFIQNGDDDLIKIGMTRRLSDRIKELQTGNPRPLRIVGYIKAHNALELEETFHYFFENRKHAREWFKLSRAQATYVLKNYREYGDKIFYVKNNEIFKPPPELKDPIKKATIQRKLELEESSSESDEDKNMAWYDRNFSKSTKKK